MDSDRHPPPPPHRPATTSDLFICFTSRHHHSSSMKLPSKSILSPNRAGGRDPPFSLTTSLSRRLRTNRSIKGAASPAMFPATGKKRGSGFDNPEPSSPKVTCIGQVRIKSKKKHGKQQRLRSLSRRHSTGDVSFRKSMNLGSSSFGSNNNSERNNNNQRWVHLPLTICEALRAFGSEFSCLFPCRSSCFSPVREREVREQRMTSERGEEQSSGPSCAAVFTRWLVAFHDGDDGGRGGRRDVELVVGDDNINEDEDEEDRMFRASRRHVFDDLEIVNNRIQGSVDEPRVSICIPPKNALLLMRCRSDPLKMEALANRLWESTVCQHDDEQDEEYVDDEDGDEIQANDEVHMEQSIEEKEQIPETNDEKDDEFTFFGSLFDEMVDKDQENDDTEKEETETEEVKGFAESPVVESKERESVLEREGLPECLLLMMYEPKLSMEVSKETWVSSKDFIRRQPSRKKPPAPPVKPTDGQSTGSANTSSTITKDTLPSACKNNKHVSASVAASASTAVQPGRSSCSLPAPSSMAEMLEQKLVNAVGYEPFVLTRCKSEPMRTAAAKLAPDNCFWKNRKLEPLRRASFGVGAAGVGF